MSKGVIDTLKKTIDEVKLSAYRECLDICDSNGAGDSSDEIRSLIYAVEHPRFTAQDDDEVPN